MTEPSVPMTDPAVRTMRAVALRSIPWGALAGGTACLLPVIMAFVVRHFTLPLPVWDEWAWAPLIYKLHTGTLRFGDLWVQHNEHRMLFPNLIALGLASLGGWSQLRETLFGLLLVVLTQIGVYTLLRRIVTAARLPFALLAVSFLLYSPAQMENWDWGFEIGWFLVNACAVWAFLLLGTAGQSWFSVIVAAMLAFIGSYSASQGLMIWIGGLAVLLFTQKRRPLQVIAWSAAAVAAFVIYFYHFQQPQPPDLLFLLHNPQLVFRYVGAYFGGVFASWLSFELAVAIGWGGIIGLAALLTMVVNDHRRSRAGGARFASFVGIGIYTLSVAAITTVGRAGLGEAQAESSRYVSVAIYLWIAIIALVFAYAERLAVAVPRQVVRWWLVPVLALLALSIGDDRYSVRLGSNHLAVVESAYPALIAGSGPQLLVLYPVEAPLEEYMRELRIVKDGPYYE